VATTALGEELATPNGRHAPGDGRVIRRRRPLPGNRAVVGGFLVAVAIVGTFATVSSAGDDHRITLVVARDDLAVGDRITADDLTVARLDVPPFVRARAFRSTDQLLGATVLGPVARGELVQASTVSRESNAPPGLQVSFPVEAARAVDGTLRQGESVDVLVTYGQGETATTKVVAHAARVVRTRTPGGVLRDDRTLVVTLVVATAEDAAAVAHAANAGEVTIVRTGG
jgi:Flp pilus assembly protein CpaB